MCRDGEFRPLEDVIDKLMSQGGTGIVLLVGPPGSGKTTALRHVAARLALRSGAGDRCRFVDTDEFPSMDPEAKDALSGLTITAACDSAIKPAQTLTLARWGRDAMTGHAEAHEILARMLDAIDMSEQEPFFLMEPIQCLMACEYYIDQLRSPRGQSILRQRLPDDLLPSVADALRHDNEVIDQLQKVLTRKVDRALHSASATLLVAIDPTWRPREILREANLNEATLNRVSWPGIDLSRANLNNASLNDANLSNARLAGATFHSASLRRANLQGRTQRTALQGA